MKRFLSQSINIGGQPIKGPLDPSLNSLASVIDRILGFVIPAAAIVLFFVLVFGGYEYMTSQGNPEKVKRGQAVLFSAVIGFLLLIFSFVIVKVVSFIFGLTGSGIL